LINLEHLKEVSSFIGSGSNGWWGADVYEKSKEYWRLGVDGITSYIVIGVAVIAVLAGVVFLFLRRGKKRTNERDTGRTFLMLGIIFLIPGLFNLIMDGETSVFLSLGIIFTLSGLVSVYLLKPSIFPGDTAQIRTGGLIGFLLGGVLGAAVSMVFGYPSVIAILVSASLGVLLGIAFVMIFRRFSEA
jgi:hypothetical protein